MRYVLTSQCLVPAGKPPEVLPFLNPLVQPARSALGFYRYLTFLCVFSVVSAPVFISGIYPEGCGVGKSTCEIGRSTGADDPAVAFICSGSWARDSQ